MGVGCFGGGGGAMTIQTAGGGQQRLRREEEKNPKTTYRSTNSPRSFSMMLRSVGRARESQEATRSIDRIFWVGLGLVSLKQSQLPRLLLCSALLCTHRYCSARRAFFRLVLGDEEAMMLMND